MLLSDGESAHFMSLFDIGKVYCFGKYVGILKDAFIEYKFHGKIWLGKKFGKMIYETFSEVLREYDYLVYVPVSSEGLKKRGFDQCEEIAQIISQLSGIPILDLLECSSLKGTQSKLSRKGRTENVQGKFRLKSGGLLSVLSNGGRVILLDDILTTGATLKECGELILKAGATNVDALVFATGRADV